MRSVAFFRNLNLGQSRSPTKEQLVNACITAGATNVRSFQVNGTLVFTASRPEETVARALALLAPVCLYRDVAMVRPDTVVLNLAEHLAAVELVEQTEVSFFDHVSDFPVDVPFAAPRRNCEVREVGSGYAVTLNERPHTSNATRVLEDLLDVPVTSRGVSTIVRLARSLAAA